MTFPRLLLAWLCLLVPLLGCRTLRNIGSDVTRTVSDPTITVEALRVAQRSAYGTRYEVDLVIQNPNDFPLALVSSSHTLVVSGSAFEFAGAPHRTVPSRGNAEGTQRVTLAGAVPMVGPEPEAVSVRGKMVFEPPGQFRKLLTESGLPLPSAAFSSGPK